MKPLDLGALISFAIDQRTVREPRRERHHSGLWPEFKSRFMAQIGNWQSGFMAALRPKRVVRPLQT
jgi:hypothetical protein